MTISHYTARKYITGIMHNGLGRIGKGISGRASHNLSRSSGRTVRDSLPLRRLGFVQ